MENTPKDKFSKCKYSFAEPCIKNEVVSIKYHCLKDNCQIEDRSICENCKKFISSYIEYPIEISEIETKPFDTDGGVYKNKVGSFVSVRPCSEEYKEKTFLGILLGDFPIAPFISYNTKTKGLSVSALYNPAIYVPCLKKIIFGNESWWCLIETEEDLKNISDKDIENTWYVKALKELTNRSD